MLSAGQDFVRSKAGVGNTYQRGDLNALKYERLDKFRDLHEYTRFWIRFRLGEEGDLLRLASYPKKTYWKEYTSTKGTAVALLLNADESLGPKKLLFAINPDEEEASLPVQLESLGSRELLATADSWTDHGVPPTDDFRIETNGKLAVAPLQLGMWRIR